MSIEALKNGNCNTRSNAKKFGLCDDPLPGNTPAYIDEEHGENWVAVVNNELRYKVVFTALDHCVASKTSDNSDAKRCDGVLTYENTVIFVELKDREPRGNKWVIRGEIQLRSSIVQMEKLDLLDDFKIKKAYIANRQHPQFKSSQKNRMNEFLSETGCVLRIENRIML